MRARSDEPVQHALFEAGPPGLATRDDFVTRAEERELLEHFAALPFRPFEFQGWLGRRETVSFGWHYDFEHARLLAAPALPEFLVPLRERAAAFAGLAPAALEQALVIRYDEGAGIGWHRDRPVFDQIVGLSLCSACVLRFRRREGRAFRRFALFSPPRSAYLLTGEVRDEWEHSIASVEARRYSVTFRSRRKPRHAALRPKTRGLND
jgi:alkylated DNA repair protein (DNA oxidative demethylase)